MAKRSFKPTNADERNMVLLPSSADDLPERVTVDLDAENPDDFEIDVIDDTPEEDRGRPNARRLTALEEEADLRDISEKVKKRINRLRFEVESQNREKTAAERERDAAVQALRDREEELKRLRQIAENGSTALHSSMKAEREGRLADARRRLAQAHAEGNSEAMAEATSDISAVQAELAQINARTPVPRQQEERREQPRQQNDNVHPNARAWIDRNPQFNTDSAFRNKALSVHYDLEARGIRASDPRYVEELDKRMGTGYDNAMSEQDNSDDDAGSRPRRTNAVEQGSRAERVGAPANPRRVSLTQSELSLAKRLRLTPAQYAAEKLKYEQKGGA